MTIFFFAGLVFLLKYNPFPSIVEFIQYYPVTYNGYNFSYLSSLLSSLIVPILFLLFLLISSPLSALRYYYHLLCLILLIPLPSIFSDSFLFHFLSFHSFSLLILLHLPSSSSSFSSFDSSFGILSSSHKHLLLYILLQPIFFNPHSFLSSSIFLSSFPSLPSHSLYNSFPFPLPFL